MVPGRPRRHLGLHRQSRPLESRTDEMSDDREFRDKWQSRIDSCGPYCSCLVIIIVLVLAFFAFVIR